MGSKNRISKFIVPIIQSYIDSDTIYIEPFVGGANLIDKISASVKKGYDKNPYLIGLLDYVARGGKLPETISESKYYEVRDNKSDYPNWEVGLVGFCASYGGRFFEGYPRGLKPNGTPRDYTNESIRNLESQQDKLHNIIFHDCDYSELDLRDIKSVIYCDPPYLGTKPYKVSLLGKFNHEEFWKWVDTQSEINPVLISEYTAPENYIPIWEMEISSNLNKSGTKKSMEKLFIHKRWAKTSNNFW